MKLEGKAQEKALEKLQRVWVSNKTCPICGQTKWTVGDTVHELRAFNYGNLVVGGEGVYPVIPVACNTCGYTHFINPLPLGLIDREKGAEST